ncbi:hypothetical protein ACCO45_005378 [Purpureocillium lilacinum]|uniref:Uncharacterized protein n=1 Tax=Purpureocillium lilacinum TaxID=33203 RepID=A0ACC4DVI0_PURLI
MLSRLRTPEEDASPGTGQTETIAGDGRAWDMEPQKPPSPLLGAGLFQCESHAGRTTRSSASALRLVDAPVDRGTAAHWSRYSITHLMRAILRSACPT